MSVFTQERSLSIAARNLEFQEFRHGRTGARHVHLACDDPANAFLVGFFTPPPDSSGVAHVLEHLVLCGSRRFPMRDLFFAMRRRSLATGMNAFSSDDFTAFHFCTRYPSDFANLLDVYLDSVFAPALRPLDFAREAWRVEFETPEDTRSALRYNGIVLNEMQGAMCVPEIRLWVALKQHLFAGSAYQHNSGGNPESLVELDYARAASFHAVHYHPSNAVFMTYGDIAVEQHQARIEQTLEGFGYRQPVAAIGDALSLDHPKRVDTRYPARDGDEYAQVALAWVLGRRSNPIEYVEARVLEALLFGHPRAPLRQALASTELGRMAGRGCRLHDSAHNLVMVCGLGDCVASHSAEVEQLVEASLTALLRSPALKRELDTAFMRVVLDEQEIRADKVPYGLALLKRMLPALMDGVDAAELLDLTPSFARFEERHADLTRVAAWVERALLVNPRRIRLTLAPDHELAQARQSRERDRLAVLARALDDAGRESLVEQTRSLHEQDAHPAGTESLSFPATEELRSRADQSTRLARHHKIHVYSTCTNKLVYLHLLVALPPVDGALANLLGLYRASLPLLGGVSSQAMNRLDAPLNASLSVQTRVSRLDAVDSYLILAGKVLDTHLADLSEKLWEAFMNPRFEAARLRQIAGQLYADAQRDLVLNGHLVAQRAAAASTGPCATIIDICEGLGHVQRTDDLYQSVKRDEGVEKLARRLSGVSELLKRCRCQAFCIAEQPSLDLAVSTLERDWVLKDQALGAQPQGGELPVPGVEDTVWLTDSPVGFCARAYRTVPEGHEDVAALMVLAALLENVVLHPAIRGAGGAYGTGASYCRDTGALRLFSYRDPRLGATLRCFDDAATFATRAPCTDTELLEARVSALRTLESVDSPPQLALRSLVDACHGRFSQHRRKLRAQILVVERDRLAEVAARYMAPELSSTVVITGRQTAKADPYPGLQTREMGESLTNARPHG